MDLEGMTGEKAEPYFTLEDILPTLHWISSQLTFLQAVNFSAAWHQFK